MKTSRVVTYNVVKDNLDHFAKTTCELVQYIFLIVERFY